MRISSINNWRQKNYINFNSDKRNKDSLRKTQNEPLITSSKKNKKNDKASAWKYIGIGAAIIFLIIESITERHASNRLKEELEHSKQLENELKELNSKLKQELKNLEESFSSFPTSPSIEEAKPNIQDTIAEFKKVQKEAQIKEQEDQKLTAISLKASMQEVLKKQRETLGLGKIIGYEKEKNILTENVIKPILNNDVEQIPNLVLLYGPQGTGKSLLSKSIAELSQNTSYEFSYTLDRNFDLENLKDIANKAKENYVNTGKHSIIRMEEADIIFDFELEKEETVKAFVEIIDKLAKESHATIIATANFPQNINKLILQSNKSLIIPIMPAQNENLIKILEYYIKPISEGEINYEEIVQVLQNKSDIGMYSNARIANIINKQIQTANKMSNDAQIKLLNQKDLIEIFENSTPDIGKDYFVNCKL